MGRLSLNTDEVAVSAVVFHLVNESSTPPIFPLYHISNLFPKGWQRPGDSFSPKYNERHRDCGRPTTVRSIRNFLPCAVGFWNDIPQRYYEWTTTRGSSREEHTPF
ncbi:hypothetical protein EVAR_55678_1 [Eumeta japonica]|uniref:Uncharacterized protein n=1 Tax=Eumeta variegata TaxID=151549 RepID=A0A4C1ZBI6_EUMVA|nr:hypothetical protein EVAR_55678_1 [Eumeta japonica]